MSELLILSAIDGSEQIFSIKMGITGTQCRIGFFVQTKKKNSEKRKRDERKNLEDIVIVDLKVPQK